MSSRGTLAFLSVLAVAGCGALVWGGYNAWQKERTAASTQTETERFRPELRVQVAERQAGPVKVKLPGQTRPIQQASLYARATGYVAERRVDIGSRVRKGDLLARISAPDLDQQLLQAKAQIGQYEASIRQAKATTEQARANRELAKVTQARTAKLAEKGYQTQQNLDNSDASVQTQTANVEAGEAAEGVARANLEAQQATVRRLTELAGFKDIVAPFDGVVTTRGIEVGDHVTADQSGASARPLFTVAQDTVLRVQTYVPQGVAAGIRAGIPAEVTVPELPGRTFSGTVARDASALNESTRTLLVEVDVPNAEAELRAGLYAMVGFAIPRAGPSVTVPAEALVFDSDGLRVATVGDGDKVRMRKVSIARDFGARVELRDGLDGGERVALSPPADLADGQSVAVKANAGEDKMASRS